MKKRILCMMLAVVGAMSAVQADDYPYLAFQTADGTVKAVSITSLTLTFQNGALTATNADGSYSFALADLGKMFFTTEPTAVQPLPVEGGDVEVFSVTGISLGRFASLQAAEAQMPRGIYVVKTDSETIKLMKR